MADPLPAPRILVVDDIAANRFALRRLLARTDAHTIEADSGEAALAACLHQQFALILLDVNMPGMDGFEVATLLADHPHQTPIIFVTAAYRDAANRMRGYSSGAVDFIEKPIDETILLSKVRVFLELYRGKQALQAALAELEQRNALLQREIVERQSAEQRARHQATHDPLTGLPNRLLFVDRLAASLARTRRRGDPLALAYLDIDGFKAVNDRHGHHAGDLLLQQIGERLRGLLREEDTVARLGGDEFALLLEGVVDPDQAHVVAGNVIASLSMPFSLALDAGPVDVRVGASIGIARAPQDADEVDALVQLADAAMYEAKRGGRNRCVVAGT